MGGCGCAAGSAQKPFALELLSWIQVRVDENKAKGQYILTGSHQKSAMTWHRDFAADLAKFQCSIPDAEDGYVIYAGDLFPKGTGFTALGHASTAKIFA